MSRQGACVGPKNVLNRLVCFRRRKKEKHEGGVKTVFHLKKQVHLRFFLVLRRGLFLRLLRSVRKCFLPRFGTAPI